MALKILVADDEPDLRDMVRYNLETEGYEVVVAADGREAVELAQSEQPDLIVLDVRMPRLSGLEACRKIRAIESLADTPVIILTALGQEQDEIMGLESGADDYIQKPVSPKVLITRIKTRLRRAEMATRKLATLSRGDLTIDRDRFDVRRTTGDEEEKFHLPRKQFELLFALALHPGIVFSREELLDSIWGQDVYVTPRTVDVHVRKIRDKIGDDYIETVKGVGYRFKE